MERIENICNFVINEVEREAKVKIIGEPCLLGTDFYITFNDLPTFKIVVTIVRKTFEEQNPDYIVKTIRSYIFKEWGNLICKGV